jgi:hypothetical protein
VSPRPAGVRSRTDPRALVPYRQAIGVIPARPFLARTGHPVDTNHSEGDIKVFMIDWTTSRVVCAVRSLSGPPYAAH